MLRARARLSRGHLRWRHQPALRGAENAVVWPLVFQALGNIGDALSSRAQLKEDMCSRRLSRLLSSLS